MGNIRYISAGSKGSSISHSDSSVNRQSSTLSPLKQVISLLEELDESRQTVVRKEQELEQAKQSMATATQKFQAKLESLDSSTRDLIKGMLGQIDGKENDSLTQEETKGKVR